MSGQYRVGSTMKPLPVRPQAKRQPCTILKTSRQDIPTDGRPVTPSQAMAPELRDVTTDVLVEPETMLIHR